VSHRGLLLRTPVQESMFQGQTRTCSGIGVAVHERTRILIAQLFYVVSDIFPVFAGGLATPERIPSSQQVDGLARNNNYARRLKTLRTVSTIKAD
jgi:hypothetical protein